MEHCFIYSFTSKTDAQLKERLLIIEHSTFCINFCKFSIKHMKLFSCKLWTSQRFLLTISRFPSTDILQKIKARQSQCVWMTTPRGTVNQELKLNYASCTELVMMVKILRFRRPELSLHLAKNLVYVTEENYILIFFTRLCFL